MTTKLRINLIIEIGVHIILNYFFNECIQNARCSQVLLWYLIEVSTSFWLNIIARSCPYRQYINTIHFFFNLSSFQTEVCHHIRSSHYYFFSFVFFCLSLLVSHKIRTHFFKTHAQKIVYLKLKMCLFICFFFNLWHLKSKKTVESVQWQRITCTKFYLCIILLLIPIYIINIIFYRVLVTWFLFHLV